MVTLTPNPSYSLNLLLELPNQSGMLSAVTQAIADAGGSFGQISLIESNLKFTHREITVNASSSDHADQIVEVVKSLDNIKLMRVSDRTFDLHRQGKISVESRIPLTAQSDLAMAYTPGVGRICRAIAEDPEKVYSLTIKSNTVAVVTDGSAVLGLGNLGPEASLPVMEGKAMLFKEFAQIDAFPICLNTQDTEEIIRTVKAVAPVFGGVNLEDIAAPRCFEIEARLKEELDIPIFHDDQHGTAIVTLAALLNSLKIVHKTLGQIRIVINGAGAAGLAIAELLKLAGVQEIWLCDSQGIVSQQRQDLNEKKQAFVVAAQGSLADAMKGADVFLGVSAPGVVTPEMVRLMTKDPIVFAMANPIPEIQPELIQTDAAVIATGRSDYPNQINNVLAFPGVFRGALDCRASTITPGMCLEAAKAIAALVSSHHLDGDHIIPSVFDPRVSHAVASAVQLAARNEGVTKE